MTSPTVIEAPRDMVVEVTAGPPGRVVIELAPTTSLATSTVAELVESTAEVVDVVTPGPTGPVGPRGPQGIPGPSGAGRYVYTQPGPATVWTITHEIGFDPAGVTVISDDGYQLDDFGVQYLTPGESLRLSFDIPVAGVAYLS